MATPHHMIDEIREQPKAVSDTLKACVDEAKSVVQRQDVEKMSMVYFTGSGTSYHACLAANYALSSLTQMFGSTLPASEFPKWIRQARANETMLVAISQSGESSDILAAAHAAMKSGIHLVAVTNTPKSTLANLSEFNIISRAGEERAVTATKSFTATLTAAYLLMLELARRTIADKYRKMMAELLTLPTQMEQTIALCEKPVMELASRLKEKEFFFLLGSGSNYPTALEGALKLKEACDLHAEGFATREFLHGPIRLVDQNTPVLIIESEREAKETGLLSESFLKFGAPTIEISPRNGQAPRDGVVRLEVAAGVSEVFSTPVNIIPLQIYAYYSALVRNLNPDHPEKLTKVVG